MHDCERFRWPTSNTDYWYSKLRRNVERDRINQEKLRDDGWNVIVVWECDIKKRFEEKMAAMINQIIEK